MAYKQYIDTNNIGEGLIVTTGDWQDYTDTESQHECNIESEDVTKTPGGTSGAGTVVSSYDFFIDGVKHAMLILLTRDITILLDYLENSTLKTKACHYSYSEWDVYSYATATIVDSGTTTNWTDDIYNEWNDEVYQEELDFLLSEGDITQAEYDAEMSRKSSALFPPSYGKSFEEISSHHFGTDVPLDVTVDITDQWDTNTQTYLVDTHSVYKKGDCYIYGYKTYISGYVAVNRAGSYGDYASKNNISIVAYGSVSKNTITLATGTRTIYNDGSRSDYDDASFSNVFFGYYTVSEFDADNGLLGDGRFFDDCENALGIFIHIVMTPLAVLAAYSNEDEEEPEDPDPFSRPDNYWRVTVSHKPEFPTRARGNKLVDDEFFRKIITNLNNDRLRFQRYIDTPFEFDSEGNRSDIYDVKLGYQSSNDMEGFEDRRVLKLTYNDTKVNGSIMTCEVGAPSLNEVKQPAGLMENQEAMLCFKRICEPMILNTEIKMYSSDGTLLKKKFHRHQVNYKPNEDQTHDINEILNILNS